MRGDFLRWRLKEEIKSKAAGKQRGGEKDGKGDRQFESPIKLRWAQVLFSSCALRIAAQAKLVLPHLLAFFPSVFPLWHVVSKGKRSGEV